MQRQPRCTCEFEQRVVGHILRLWLDRLGIPARVGMDGHERNWEALVAGTMDVYVEYVGTALRRFLGLRPCNNRELAWQQVRQESYRLGLEWLPPFGFDNTFGVIVRQELAKEYGLRRVSDLAPIAGQLRIGGIRDFIIGAPSMHFAPGGLAALQRSYGLKFGEAVELPEGYGASFTALRDGHVDIIVDLKTNPRIRAWQLLVLEDDRSFFAVYQAAPVARAAFLARYPRAVQALKELAGRIGDEDVIRMNYEVEFGGKDPLVVAENWLAAMTGT